MTSTVVACEDGTRGLGGGVVGRTVGSWGARVGKLGSSLSETSGREGTPHLLLTGESVSGRGLKDGGIQGRRILVGRPRIESLTGLGFASRCRLLPFDTVGGVNLLRKLFCTICRSLSIWLP